MKTLPLLIEDVYRYDELYRDFSGQMQDSSVESLRIARGALYLESVDFSPTVDNFGGAVRTKLGSLYYDNVYARYCGNSLASSPEPWAETNNWLDLRITHLHFSIPTSYDPDSSAKVRINKNIIKEVELSTKLEDFYFHNGRVQLNVRTMDVVISFDRAQTYFSAVQQIKIMSFLLNLQEIWCGTPYDIKLSTALGNYIEVFFKEDSYTENSDICFTEPWDVFTQNFSQQLSNLTQLLDVFPNKSWWEPTLLTEHNLVRQGFTTNTRLFEPGRRQPNALALKKDFAHAFDFFEMILRAEYIRTGYALAQRESMKNLLARYMNPSTQLQSYASNLNRNGFLNINLPAALRIRNALHHTFLSTPLTGKDLEMFQERGWMNELANDLWQASWCILALDTLGIDDQHFGY